MVYCQCIHDLSQLTWWIADCAEEGWGNGGSMAGSLMRRDSMNSLRSSRIAESGMDDFGLDSGLQVQRNTSLMRLLYVAPHAGRNHFVHEAYTLSFACIIVAAVIRTPATLCKASPGIYRSICTSETLNHWTGCGMYCMHQVIGKI